MRALGSWLLLWALLFAGAGAVLWVNGNEVIHSHEWTVLRVPLGPSAGELVTREFSTDLNGTYQVLLEIVTDLNDLEASTLLGRCWYSSDGEAEPIRIPWNLHAGGSLVRTSEGRGRDGVFIGPRKIRVSLGEFEGTVGGSYEIIAMVRDSVPQLLDTEPRLKVKPHPRHYENALMAGAIRGLGALVSIAIAAVLLIVFLARLILTARKNKMRATIRSPAGATDD